MVRMVIERLRLGNGNINIKLVNTFALQWDMFWIRMFFFEMLVRCLLVVIIFQHYCSTNKCELLRLQWDVLGL